MDTNRRNDPNKQINYSLLKKKGVKIFLNSNVDKIIVKSNKATGVISNGKSLHLIILFLIWIYFYL